MSEVRKIVIDLPLSILVQALPSLKYTLTTLALVSYLCSPVERALHRHRKSVGSISAGERIVGSFFSIVPCLNSSCV